MVILEGFGLHGGRPAKVTLRAAAGQTHFVHEGRVRALSTFVPSGERRSTELEQRLATFEGTAAGYTTQMENAHSKVAELESVLERATELVGNGSGREGWWGHPVTVPRHRTPADDTPDRRLITPRRRPASGPGAAGTLRPR